MTIMIPRGYENEDNFVVFAVDGRSYRLPKGHEVFWPMTNADRIRAMSDEGLIDLFRYRGCPPDRLTGKCVKVCACEACWVDWLKQPYEGE
jgi:hypothetical protein